MISGAIVGMWWDELRPSLFCPAARVAVRRARSNDVLEVRRMDRHRRTRGMRYHDGPGFEWARFCTHTITCTARRRSGTQQA